MIANGHFLRVVAERHPELQGVDLLTVLACADRLDEFERFQMRLANMVVEKAGAHREQVELGADSFTRWQREHAEDDDVLRLKDRLYRRATGADLRTSPTSKTGRKE